MSKINLYKKALSPKNFIALFLFLGLLLLETLFFIFLTKNQKQELESLQGQHQVLIKNEERLVQKIQEEKAKPIKFTPSQKALSLEEIQRNIKRSLLLLNIIANNLPEKSWLESIQEDGEKFHITGFAYDNTIVSSYIENLQKTNQFTEINLLFSEKAENSQYKKFSLTCFFQKPKNS